MDATYSSNCAVLVYQFLQFVYKKINIAYLFVLTGNDTTPVPYCDVGMPRSIKLYEDKSKCFIKDFIHHHFLWLSYHNLLQLFVVVNRPFCSSVIYNVGLW